MSRYLVDREGLTGPLIAWGIGEHDRQNFFVTENRLADFDLVGSRDRGVKGAEWVPCPSCMSPYFDKEYEVQHEAVYYRNGTDLPNVEIPASTNRVPLKEAIAFLGSAETVHTNSYHGMYWAMLLGKKVVVDNPYCSKFFQMQPASLEECREANIKFDEKVRDVLFCNSSA